MLISGEVDYATAEELLSDAAFWSGLPAADAARLAEVAVRIRDELAGGKPGALALAGAWAVELLILVTRLGERHDAGKRPWKAPDGVWSIEDAIRYIELNYDEAFSLEWFTGKCAMNTSDFSRRFKERAGCPLFEFINRQRIERACALLKSSSLSIIEISEAVGYNNLSFFNRYFLRIVGLSPREYRSSAR
jgi:AraC-like DNA-binding protein